MISPDVVPALAGIADDGFRIVTPVGEYAGFDLGIYVKHTATTHYLRDNHDGTWTWVMSQDVGNILDVNHEIASQNGGWNASRDLRRVASIPHVVAQDWKHQGVDIHDPNDDKEVRRRLNSNEFYKLRTADWMV